MNKLVTLSIWMFGLSAVSFFVSLQNLENFSKISSYIAEGTTLLGLVSIIQNTLDNRNRNKKIFETEIIPTISPLITMLTISKDYTEKQIQNITTPINGNLENITEFNSMIVLIASRFCNLLKVETDYHKSYAVALSYKLVEAKKINPDKRD